MRVGVKPCSVTLERPEDAARRECCGRESKLLRHVDGHHLKHWLHGGETKPDNLALLCTYHHGLLHEGGFSIVKEGDGSLRFVTADGRSIPRNGYRLEDFVDDDVDAESDDALDRPSCEGLPTTTGKRPRRHGEVREAAAVYRIGGG